VRWENHRVDDKNGGEGIECESTNFTYKLSLWSVQ